MNKIGKVNWYQMSINAISGRDHLRFKIPERCSSFRSLEFDIQIVNGQTSISFKWLICQTSLWPMKVKRPNGMEIQKKLLQQRKQQQQHIIKQRSNFRWKFSLPKKKNDHQKKKTQWQTTMIHEQIKFSYFIGKFTPYHRGWPLILRFTTCSLPLTIITYIYYLYFFIIFKNELNYLVVRNNRSRWKSKVVGPHDAKMISSRCWCSYV